MNDMPARWLPPPDSAVLTETNEIHLWRIDLKPPTTNAQPFIDVLSGDELRRAAKYRFVKDRQNFIFSRAALRDILGFYLDLPPGEIVFSYNRFGKPGLSVENSALRRNGLEFSFSRSNEIAVCAVAAQHAVGVDIEFVSAAQEDNQEIVRRFFSRGERRQLEALPAARRDAGFYACWTRKEAFLKAAGTGFALAPDQFTVSANPAETGSTAAFTKESRSFSATLRSFSPAKSYAAALAATGEPTRVSFWQWLPLNFDA